MATFNLQSFVPGNATLSDSPLISTRLFKETTVGN